MCVRRTSRSAERFSSSATTSFTDPLGAISSIMRIRRGWGRGVQVHGGEGSSKSLHGGAPLRLPALDLFAQTPHIHTRLPRAPPLPNTPHGHPPRIHAPRPGYHSGRLTWWLMLRALGRVWRCEGLDPTIETTGLNLCLKFLSWCQRIYHKCATFNHE